MLVQELNVRQKWVVQEEAKLEVNEEGDETGFGPSRKVATKIVRYGVGAEMDSIAVRCTNPPGGK